MNHVIYGAILSAAIGDLGERCKLPKRGLGRSLAEIKFDAF